MISQPMLIALTAGMILLTGTAMWAGRAGWGLTKPEKQPISIREGSVRTAGGFYRTRYFVGGGLHRGK